MSKFQCIQRIFAVDSEKIMGAAEKYPNTFRDGMAVVTYNGVYTDNELLSDYENYCTFMNDMKTKGMMVQVNLSVTIGHGGEPSEKAYPMMMDYDQRTGAACPRSEAFRKHLCETVHRYAVLKPDVFWIDDDFRLSFHGAVAAGCFCDHCIGQFNRRTGNILSRERLKEMLAADGQINGKKIRGEWQAYNRECMLSLAELIVKTVHSVDDGIIVGYMQVNPQIVMYEYPHFTDLIQISRNKNGDVWFRHGSGFYTDRSPYEMVEKNLAIARLCAMTEGAHVVNLSEEVTYPYIRRAKSMQITLLEAVMNIGIAGVDGIMDEAIKPNLDEQLQEGAIVSEMNRRYSYLTELRKLIEGKTQIGIYPYFHPDLWQYNDPVEHLSQMTDMGAFCWTNLFYLGIPITFRREGANILLFSGKTVRAMETEELKEWLEGGIYMDGAAAEEVNRKMGQNITGVAASSLVTDARVEGRVCGYSETFTSHRLNGEHVNYRRYNFSRGSQEGNRLLVSAGGDVLSYSMSSAEEKQGIIGTAVCENKYGGRIAVCCRAPWSDDILGSAKGTQIKNIMDWLCGGKMPVRLDSKCRVGQSVWKNDTEKIVFLYNVDFDPADDICLMTNGIYSAEMLTDDGKWIPLTVGDEFRIPVMPAWSAAVVRLIEKNQV